MISQIDVKSGLEFLYTFRHRKLPDGYKRCLEEYLQKLALKKYSINTARTYISLFEAFINHYKEKDVL